MMSANEKTVDDQLVFLIIGSSNERYTRTATQKTVASTERFFDYLAFNICISSCRRQRLIQYIPNK